MSLSCNFVLVYHRYMNKKYEIALRICEEMGFPVEWAGAIAGCVAGTFEPPADYELVQVKSCKTCAKQNDCIFSTGDGDYCHEYIWRVEELSE